MRMTRLRALVARPPGKFGLVHAFAARQSLLRSGPGAGRRRYLRLAMFLASLLLWSLVVYSLSLMAC